MQTRSDISTAEGGRDDTGLLSRPPPETAHLRLAFLLPLAVAIVAIFGIWVALLYSHERATIDDEIARDASLMERLYHDDIRDAARTLGATMRVIEHHPAMRRALARRDHEELLRLAAPLNADLRREFGITHFYFSGPDRKVILRVHQPDRRGDRIDRFTTLEAERTGGPSHGVELGPLGTFTLRLVAPWYEEGRLLGYVELGMEIDDLLKNLRTFTQVPVFVLIAKNRLDREDWEAGMRMLGREPEWDRFPQVVLSRQSTVGMPPAVAEYLVRGMPGEVSGGDISWTGDGFRVTRAPLLDAASNQVGWMISLIDLSAHGARLRGAIYRGALFGAAIGGLLFGFFFWLVQKVGNRIDRNEAQLQRIATHDGLTGLINHRTFYMLLAEEMTRALRFNRPLSLLMLDIDHFKKANDTYGHQAGDAILKELAALLTRHARSIDKVCRYGGEEIAIMLPESDLASAAEMAERLRREVEGWGFEPLPGSVVTVTVSIGVACWQPKEGRSPRAVQALVAAADAALYEAKHGGRNRVERHEPGAAR